MNFLEAYSWVNIRFLLNGLLITLEVAAYTIVFSVLIGIILGVIRFAKIPYFSKGLGVVIDTIRNLPLLLIIFFIIGKRIFIYSILEPIVVYMGINFSSCYTFMS